MRRFAGGGREGGPSRPSFKVVIDWGTIPIVEVVGEMTTLNGRSLCFDEF